MESKSDFGSLDADILDEDIVKRAEEIQKEDRAKEAQKKAGEAKEKAWKADCGSFSFLLHV